MSWGMCICSNCHREVHQSGDMKRSDRGWEHCGYEGSMKPICSGSSARYAKSLAEVQGDYCGMDGVPPGEEVDVL